MNIKILDVVYVKKGRNHNVPIYITTLGEMRHNQLARYVGLSPSCLSNKIRKHGFRSPKALVFGQRGRPKGRKKARQERPQGRPLKGEEIGTPEYRALGSRPRTSNLKNIPDPGLLERWRE